MTEKAKTREQLRLELIAWKQRLQAQRLVSQRVRGEIGRMQSSHDVEALVRVIYEGLRTLEVPFAYCGVNIFDQAEEPTTLTAHNMSPRGEWNHWEGFPGDTLLRIWRRGVLAYRRDLHTDDPYGERVHIPYMRAVVDVPFARGTLAVSSPQPEAFSAEDLDVLQDMALLLSDGFRRLEDLRQVEERNVQLEQEVEERSQAQARLQQSLAELERAHADLRLTQARLVQSEKMAALGDLVAGVAHELNSPAGSIVSTRDTLGRTVQRLGAALTDRADLQGLLEVLERSGQVMGDGAERVAQIVASLRRFVRLDEAEWQLADIHEGLDSALTLLDSRLGNGIEIERQYGAVEPLWCAPGQLNQVFMHVLKNAVESIAGTGRISLATGQEGGQVWVRIADTGRGMDQQQLDRIFDPALAGDTGRVGLSWRLAADYLIVRDHGGEIEVDSQVGEGTVVHFRLPLRQVGTGLEEEGN
ncbi:MAG: hypothetical protein GKR89_23890 [Candidatus Latescibacteria bacterium]|nr:hypothetical protein [Candidatus Latescibacterota bacterium]